MASGQQSTVDVNQYLQTAFTLLTELKYNDAYLTLTNAIKREPQNALALIHRAQVCAILGKSDEMMQDIAVVVALFPEWPQNNYLVRSYLKKSKDARSQGKKYQFILKGRFILWFDEGQFKNGAYLHNFQIAEDSGKKEKFDIQVANASPFHLEADNQNHKNQWIRELTNIISLPKISTFTIQGKEEKMADWILKSGGKNKNFKKRYCVVRGFMFYYYVSPNDPAPKGSWDLRGCDLGRYSVQAGSTKFKWKVTLKEDSQKGKTDERNLHVDTAEKRESWLKVLLAASKPSLSLVEKPVARQVPTEKIPNATTLSPPALPSTAAPENKPLKKDVSSKKNKGQKGPSLEDSITSFTGLINSNTPPLQEIVEMISPRSNISNIANMEKEKTLNAEAMKIVSNLSFDEEWEDEDGGNDWISEDEGDGRCFIS